MPDPQITTVIPTYRRPELLRRAIESALAQTYPHTKVAVFDNASGDETPDVVAEISERDPRVVYRCQPENLGPRANWQSGLDAVDTPYFSFLSDDDLLLPRFYERAMAELRAEPKARFFCGQTVIYYTRNGTHRLSPGDEWWSEGLHPAALEVPDMIERRGFTWTSCVFSSGSRQRVGRFPPGSSGDSWFMLSQAALYPFAVSHLPCTIYTVTGTNYWYTISASEWERSHRALVEALASLGVVSREVLERLSRHLERDLLRYATRLMRPSFLQGNWKAFEEAASIAEARSRLAARWRLRTAVARRRRGLAWILRCLQRQMVWHHRLKRLLKRRGTKTSLVDVVRLYSGDAALPGAFKRGLVSSPRKEEQPGCGRPDGTAA